MQIQEDDILSPRIRMHINGHRFLAAFRVNHPAHPEPTEYAIFKTEDDYVISVMSGGDPMTGRLVADDDAGAIADGHQAVDDFHNVDPSFWERRATDLTT